MARETKISLLVGMVIILLVGILVSDHISSANKQGHGSMTGFGPRAQKSVSSEISRNGATPAIPLTPGSEATLGEPLGRPAIDPPAPTRMDVVPPPIGKDLVEAGRVGYDQPPLGLGGSNTLSTGATDSLTGLTPSMDGTTPTTSLFGPTPKPTAAEPPPLAKHVVAKGDTLYKLAARYYHDAGSWKLIQDANAAALQANRGNLKEGSTLIIPARPPAPELPAGDQPGMFERITPDRAPGASDGVQVKIVEVAPGQNLTTIAAQQLGDGNRWKEILAANKDQIRKPEDLKIGMKLKMPATERTARSDTRTDARSTEPVRTVKAEPPARKPPQSYTVRAGDTLYSISQRHMGDRGRWKEILAMNRGKLEGPHDLKIGEVIRLPANGGH